MEGAGKVLRVQDGNSKMYTFTVLATLVRLSADDIAQVGTS